MVVHLLPSIPSLIELWSLSLSNAPPHLSIMYSSIVLCSSFLQYVLWIPRCGEEFERDEDRNFEKEGTRKEGKDGNNGKCFGPAWAVMPIMVLYFYTSTVIWRKTPTTDITFTCKIIHSTEKNMSLHLYLALDCNYCLS